MHALVDGNLVALDQAHIPIWDLGFTSGVSVTEQFRTVGGRIWLPRLHLDRMEFGLREAFLNWPSPREDVARLAEELVRLGVAELPPGDDLGFCVVVTGGDFAKFAPISASTPSNSRLLLHSFRLDHLSNSRRFRQGISLVTVPTREIPGNSLSRQLKSRSRIHYWIAQHQAESANRGAEALLMNDRCEVLESPTASLVAITHNHKVCLAPPQKQILAGVTLQWVLEVFERQFGMTVHRRPITLDEFQQADEILSLSTPYLAASVTTVDGKSIGAGRPGPNFERIHSLFNHLTGCDLREQAMRFQG